MDWYRKSVDETARALGTEAAVGLTGAEAAARLEKHGPNALKQAKKRALWQMYLAQLKDVMVLVLLAAALISGVLLGEWVDAGIILLVVLLNALLGVIQENRAEKSLEALKKLSSPHAKVRRDGEISSVPAADLVPGDVVLLENVRFNPEETSKDPTVRAPYAKKVAALNKDGVAGSYLAGQSGGALVFDLFPSVWADGESVMNKDGSEATLDNDSMKGVLDAYKELANTTNGLGAGSKEETGATWTAPFANGKIGVMPYPNTSTTALFDAEKDGGFEVGVAPIPGTKEGKTSTFLGGDAMGISKDSKHVAQAWNFLYWLMQSDAQKEVFADQGDTASNIQTLKTAYKDADPRIQTINSVIIDGNGQTPKSPAFNEAFNAAGSPWQLLVQNAVWGSGDLKADNKAVTDVLSAQ